MNEQQRHEQMIKNSTKFITFDPALYYSSSSADRTRTVIYILGIIFMIIVFFVLLWINLYSRQCAWWHDTSLMNRFNRQWLIKRSIARNTAMSSSNNQPQRMSFTSDELNI